jgi:hypothetical protein
MSELGDFSIVFDSVKSLAAVVYRLHQYGTNVEQIQKMLEYSSRLFKVGSY